MKKITILIALMITSLGFSQTPEGTWTFTQAAGAFVVGGSQGNADYFSSPAPGVRPCQYDDEFVFNADGTFQNVLQTETWIEDWQVPPQGCGTPVAPHDGMTPATWAYSAGNITLTGVGAFLGLPKAVNGAELSSSPGLILTTTTRTYIVTTLTSTNMTLDILVGPPGGAWWRFNFTKKQAGTPTIGALSFPASPITVGDAPFDLVDPTSDSSGSFSYMSSNPLVATVTGNTVFIVGEGTTKITATQAAAAPFVGGEVNNDLYIYAIPGTTPAPTPPARTPSDVISLFSGAYADLPATQICQCWGQPSVADDVDPGNGDLYKRLVKFNYQGVVLDGAVSPINVSVGYKLHIDVFNTDLEPLEVSLISPGKENPVVVTPSTLGWNSYDIDVNTTNYATPDLTNIIQLKLESRNGLHTTYFDNLYFWKGTALGVAKFDASGIKMYPNPVKNSLNIEANSAIQKVSVYNVLGQEVMSKSPKSTTTTLQTSSLQKGVYMVKTEIDGNVTSSKIIKE
jgi:hypothetical protein